MLKSRWLTAYLGLRLLSNALPYNDITKKVFVLLVQDQEGLFVV